MHLAELKPGLALVGLEPDRVCTVVAVVPHAQNAVQVIYRLPDGAIKERLLGTADEATIAVATVERAKRFYEAKMAAVFRWAKQLLHPAGRMVVMFNHKMTKAWRALGKALIEAGFEIRTSIPIHTEAESSLNIRGLDAARSTVLLLCLPREEQSQVTGNWGRVQDRIATVARNAAMHFQKQGIFGTDLYLSALGPALGEVGQHWPITDFAGRPVDPVRGCARRGQNRRTAASRHRPAADEPGPRRPQSPNAAPARNASPC